MPCRSSQFFRLLVLAFACWAAPAMADLQEIKSRGELRHLGIRYANFVTVDGKGFDVELVQGFARHIGVKYRSSIPISTTSSAICWAGMWCAKATRFCFPAATRYWAT
jgi:hypothetical protein